MKRIALASGEWMLLGNYNEEEAFLKLVNDNIESVPYALV
jgi:hypothetical protein